MSEETKSCLLEKETSDLKRYQKHSRALSRYKRTKPPQMGPSSGGREKRLQDESSQHRRRLGMKAMA